MRVSKKIVTYYSKPITRQPSLMIWPIIYANALLNDSLWPFDALIQQA